MIEWGRRLAVVGLGLWAFSPVEAAERPASYIEPPSLAEKVRAGTLRPVGERLPETPIVVDLNNGRAPGRHGGTLRTLLGRSQDVRMMVVYGYARLVGYEESLEIKPDLLERVDVEEGRIFTLRLRKGHRWSDGHPFTAEDFRYWWEDVANDRVLSPFGPPLEFVVEGGLPFFEVVDPATVRFTWSRPNPFFLPALAGALPLDIYRPAHYLKQFHVRYAERAELDRRVKDANQRDWRALHFRQDQMYRNENPEMPSLQPWVNTTRSPAQRYVFVRNPYFHRVDANGRQLPYIDDVHATIASPKLIAAKTGAGEADLQARSIQFANYTFLKQGESRNNYTVELWPIARGAQIALFPNLNVDDPEWRRLFRAADFRRALSIAVNRREINQVIYFGLASESNNTVLPRSPLFRPEYATTWAAYDLDRANRLLDSLGLAKRDSRGVRLLPDGRSMEIIVETAGEETEQTDVLQLVHDSWLAIGIKIHAKPLQREVLRNRVFAGSTLMSVWSGLENGIPTAELSPQELAPTSQQQLQWPKWGQYVETRGKTGEPADIPEAVELQNLYTAWIASATKTERQAIWHKMLAINADQVFSIGIVSGVLQPVVVGATLRNVPETGLFNWDPGAFFGIYRPDTFWFDKLTSARTN